MAKADVNSSLGCHAATIPKPAKTVNRQSQPAIEILPGLRYNEGMRKIMFPALFSALVLLPLAAVSAPDPAEKFPIENLSLPKTLGKIEDRFQGTGSRWVIQIQDVHTHVQAQENIAAIIDHLSAVYGFEVVGLEGGWSKTSFKESWGLPSSREKQMLARGLLEEAQITGPAYAALFSQSPLKLTGIEDPALYEENRSQYLKHLSSRAGASEKIAAVEKRLSQEKASLYNTKLKKFDDALLKFQEGKKADVFFPLLLTEMNASEVTIEDLPQILLFKEAFDKERLLDKTKLEAESKRLMETFKRKRLSFEELLKSGLIPEDQLTHYPASSAYLGLLRLQDKIILRRFFSELDTAVSRLKEKLFSSDEERQMDARWNRFQIARSLLSFEATPDALDAFRASEELIRKETADAGLADELTLALDFYSLVSKRDTVFFDKLLSDSELASSNAIVVTGGFHTAGLSRHLREAGVSYLVITPELGDTPHVTDLYYKRLADTVTASAQTLSEAQNRFFTSAFDTAFVQGVLFLQREKNIPGAVKIVTDSFSGTSAVKTISSGSGKAVSWDEFKTWDRKQQSSWVRTLLGKAQENNIRLYLLADHDVLNELIGDPDGKKIWDNVREERNNTVAVALKNPADISSELLGGKFKVERIQAASLEEAAASPKFKGRFQAALDQGLVAVILPEGSPLPDTRLVALKKHPVSLFYRLFLSNPELRALAEQDAFLDLLKDLLEEIGGTAAAGASA